MRLTSRRHCATAHSLGSMICTKTTAARLCASLPWRRAGRSRRRGMWRGAWTARPGHKVASDPEFQKLLGMMKEGKRRKKVNMENDTTWCFRPGAVPMTSCIPGRKQSRTCPIFPCPICLGIRLTLATQQASCEMPPLSPRDSTAVRFAVVPGPARALSRARRRSQLERPVREASLIPTRLNQSEAC